MRGPVDAVAVRAAFGDVLGRHGCCVPGIRPTGPGPIRTSWIRNRLHGNLIGVSLPIPPNCEGAAVAGFHVDADLPVRVRFFRDADSAESEILVVVHHIACDGESVRVLLRIW